MTRNWDYPSLSLPDVEDEFDPSADASTFTQTAHILPLSLMSADTNKKVRKRLFYSYEAIYTAIQLFEKCTISTVMKSFANIRFKELNSANINSLTNVITLDAVVHNFFGWLHIWFEAVSVCCTLPVLPTHNLHLAVPLRVSLTLTSLGRLSRMFFAVRDVTLLLCTTSSRICRHCGGRYRSHFHVS